MGKNVTDIQTILNFEKNYPDKLIICANEDVDPNIKINLVGNLNPNNDDYYMVFYDENGLIESIYQLDFKDPYSDFIDNMGQNYNLEYIHPDIKEAFTEEVKNYYDDENSRYYAKPFMSLLNNEKEKILNEVDAILKEDINKTQDIEYTICKGDIPLKGFYPNALPSRKGYLGEIIAFDKYNYNLYDTEQRAKEQIEYMKSKVYEESERYESSCVGSTNRLLKIIDSLNIKEIDCSNHLKADGVYEDTNIKSL